MSVLIVRTIFWTGHKDDMAPNSGKSAILLVAVSVATAAVVALSTLYLPSQATGDITCSTKVGTVQSGMVDVYQVTVPSDAVICINYSFHRAGVNSFSSNYGPITSSNGESSFYSCGARNGTETFACPGLSITSSPSAVSHLAGQNVTVAYGVSASGSLKNGMYWFFIESCTPILLVVGPIPSGAASWAIGSAVSCISSLDGPATSRVVGVTNINVVSVSIKLFWGRNFPRHASKTASHLSNPPHYKLQGCGEPLDSGTRSGGQSVLLLIFATAFATNPGKRISRPPLTNKSVRSKIVAMRDDKSGKA